jgi:hypothetical protein
MNTSSLERGTHSAARNTGGFGFGFGFGRASGSVGGGDFNVSVGGN